MTPERIDFVQFEVVETASPTTRQLLACTRCGALVTGRELMDRHESWHANLQAWRQDVEGLLRMLGEDRIRGDVP